MSRTSPRAIEAERGRPAPEFRKGKLTLATPGDAHLARLDSRAERSRTDRRRNLVENNNPQCAIGTPRGSSGHLHRHLRAIETENSRGTWTSPPSTTSATSKRLELVRHRTRWSEEAIAHFQEHMPECTRKRLEGQTGSRTQRQPDDRRQRIRALPPIPTRFYGP
jgi:hypothetical protein